MKDKASKKFWEIRSRSFPDYTQGNSYQTRMLEVIKENGVDFQGKTVLDLGCGSGAYTIHIAKEAAHVTALDLSEGMLEKVKASATKEKLKNINYICSNWQDYQESDAFDIVFCSLTPAINSSEAVEKAYNHALNHFINIGFADGMTPQTLHGLYNAHGLERRVKSKPKPHVRDWLDDNNLDYKIFNINGTWETFRSFDDMLSNFRDVLEANQYDVNDDITQQYLHQLKDETTGLYKSVTIYDVELIIHTVSGQS